MATEDLEVSGETVELVKSATKAAGRMVRATPHGEPIIAEEVLNAIANLLKAGLTISAEDGDFTNPNSRTLKIEFFGREITSTYFSVRQTREYEG